MKEQLDYTYYVIQVGNKLIANKYHDGALTDDEDQAITFTDFEKAIIHASAHNGKVQKVSVSDFELQVLTEQQYDEYIKQPEEEREKMAAFCRELIK